jgi:neutral ceramidase
VAKIQIYRFLPNFRTKKNNDLIQCVDFVIQWIFTQSFFCCSLLIALQQVITIMLVGVGKSKVIFRKAQFPMLGYGRLTHQSDGAETDLFARAFYFQHEKKSIAIVILECYNISYHLKKEVLKRFSEKHASAAIHADNLLICTQNTHSAPGGHHHYAFFNITTKGFRKDVFDSYVEACVNALQLAFKQPVESKLFLNVGAFSAGCDVAFNRSLERYNSNPDVELRDENNTHLAIDRFARQIRIEDTKGHSIGLINWFGVQGTCIDVANTKIHSDNKGYAASLLENDQSDIRSFVAGFACDACADVSPNYHGRAKWWPRGKYEDQFKSAYFNGFQQFELSKALMEDEQEQIPLSPTIDFEMHYFNLSSITCAPAYTNDNMPHLTGQAAAGLALLNGSPVDNPGIDSVTNFFVTTFVRYRNFLRKIPILSGKTARSEFRRLREAQGAKQILAEFQEKKVLGFNNLNNLIVPPTLSDAGNELKRQFNKGGLVEHSWMPVIVPIQIFVLGEIAIAAYPGEITTTAGVRLKKSIMEKLHHRGILDVIITSNANEYIGYTTTFEEYQFASYERGMTFFGQYTLAAMQTCFNKVAENLLLPEQKRKRDSKLHPPDFSETELKARSAEN